MVSTSFAVEFPKGNLHSAFYYSSLLPGRLKVKNATGEQFTHTAAAAVGKCKKGQRNETIKQHWTGASERRWVILVVISAPSTIFKLRYTCLSMMLLHTYIRTHIYCKHMGLLKPKVGSVFKRVWSSPLA